MKNNKIKTILCSMILMALVACAAPTPSSPPLTGNIRRVTNATELLRAIGSNRVLVLAPGEYRLPEEVPEGAPHVRAEKVFDGYQIVISNVENLTIQATPKPPAGEPAITLDRRPRILARPRYANVLTFENARNIRIDRIVAGHVFEGSCVGGVLAFKGARNINITDSELFGSGTEGLTLDDVHELDFQGSIIRDCTYGIMTINNSEDIRFRNAIFRGNREYDLININQSKDVLFDRIKIHDNYTGLKSYSDYALFNLRNSPGVVLKNSTIKDNKAVYFQKHLGAALKESGVKLGDNKFQRGITLKLR